jgi:hypothetical protein
MQKLGDFFPHFEKKDNSYDLVLEDLFQKIRFSLYSTEMLKQTLVRLRGMALKLCDISVLGFFKNPGES